MLMLKPCLNNQHVLGVADTFVLNANGTPAHHIFGVSYDYIFLLACIGTETLTVQSPRMEIHCGRSACTPTVSAVHLAPWCRALWSGRGRMTPVILSRHVRASVLLFAQVGAVSLAVLGDCRRLCVRCCVAYFPCTFMLPRRPDGGAAGRQKTAALRRECVPVKCVGNSLRKVCVRVCVCVDVPLSCKGVHADDQPKLVFNGRVVAGTRNYDRVNRIGDTDTCLVPEV